MGELSGHFLILLTVAAGLGGCLSGDPVAPQQPPSKLDPFVAFNVQRCDAFVVNTNADPAPIEARLPAGFAAAVDTQGEANFGIVAAQCLEGQVGLSSIGLDADLNFWYVDVEVTAPDWAKANSTGASRFAYVLGFYTSQEILVEGFSAINLSFSSGGAVVGGGGGSTTSASDGGVTITSLLNTPVDATGRHVRRFISLDNQTVARWDGREAILSATPTRVVQVEATGSNGWAQAVGTGPTLVETAYRSRQEGYRVLPDDVQWVGPPL